mgnify:CR=1 FL=1
MPEVKVPLDEKTIEEIKAIAHDESRSIRMQLAHMIKEQLKKIKLKK